MAKSLDRPRKGVLDEKGREVPDPTPIAVPLGYQAPETLQEMVARFTSSAFAQQGGLDGVDSFEDADDFDLDDGYPQSPYDSEFDPEYHGVKAQEIRAGIRGDHSPEFKAKAEAKAKADAAVSAAKAKAELQQMELHSAVTEVLKDKARRKAAKALEDEG